MKKIFLFLVVVIGLSACANDKTSSTNTATKRENISNKNIELVNQYFEYLNKHDWEKMTEMYSNVADFKDPSLGNGIVKQTRLATSAKYQELVMEFPDLKREVLKKTVSDENTVVVDLIATGTAKDGTKMKLPMQTIFTFQNGKIIKDFSTHNK